MTDASKLLEGRQVSQRRDKLLASSQHSSLIHPHPTTPTSQRGPSENCRTCLEKMQNFPLSLRINQPRTPPPPQPFILPTIIAKESLLSPFAPFVCFYRTTIFSPEHLPLLLKVISGANLSSKCCVPEIFEPQLRSLFV